MKRILLVIALLGGVCFPSEAQSWSDLLKGLFGSSETTEQQTAPVAVKHPSLRQLWGTWSYEEALIDYTGDDMLASMGVTALKSQIEGYCQKAGIVAGREKITLNRNYTTRIRIKEKQVEGRYTYNASTGGITLTLKVEGRDLTLGGTASLQNGELTLLFKAEEVLSAMKAAAPELSENDHIKIASTVIASYPGIRIGAKFSK